MRYIEAGVCVWCVWGGGGGLSLSHIENSGSSGKVDRTPSLLGDQATRVRAVMSRDKMITSRKRRDLIDLRVQTVATTSSTPRGQAISAGPREYRHDRMPGCAAALSLQ